MHPKENLFSVKKTTGDYFPIHSPAAYIFLKNLIITSCIVALYRFFLRAGRIGYAVPYVYEMIRHAFKPRDKRRIIRTTLHIALSLRKTREMLRGEFSFKPVYFVFKFRKFRQTGFISGFESISRNGEHFGYFVVHYAYFFLSLHGERKFLSAHIADRDPLQF